MAQGYSLKDQLFNAEKVGYLAGLFRAADPDFDPGFESRVLSRFPELELKQRIAWIADCLGPALPDDFPAAADLIEAALPPPLDPALRDDDFGDFIFCPLGDYAVIAGLEAHRDRALDLIEAVTQRFSMEYAIRHFLNRWPDETYDRLSDWAGHPSYHVRRLVSEGTRPKLPWGVGIATDPGRAMPLLDRLHADPTRFVTRSVANHLNDIAKKDAATVLDRLRAWQGGAQDPAELDWMTRHALRGLVKAGDPQALALLGYGSGKGVAVDVTLAAAKVAVGDALTFDLDLRAEGAQPVLVDYIIEFHRPSGRPGRKVFKLKQAEIPPGKPLRLSKRHPLKGDATTFRLHPGPHRLLVQVNGEIRAEAAFDLIA
ncbi:hypothetical protein GCM10011360_18910 [Primorskyibacter flagellatus]|uniref:3-methyladenine DNA glycosylase AlkC n=1 Tax=Primorskyibacter flagellatus TaxID=1387277 RepID=A0A917A6P6_9RHOB|nr:hypothetical protein [Primorskyibacter flagellatus]GGE31190.1 hypothetical protein GCM10011360_18910 [Primorskyibacter flagellatus]